jgi:hypothetical protein
MPNEVREPSAVIWNWRQAGDPQAKVREAAAARKRGLLGGVLGLAAAAVIHHFKPMAGIVVAAVALFFLILALASPLGLYRRLTELLDRFAHVVGAAVTWVLMTVLYYVFFLPVGLFLRAGGKLGITHGFDRRLASYWTKAAARPHDPAVYRKQF